MRTCDDCKFAIWDYRVFCDYSPTCNYWQGQFDCHCTKKGAFLLECEMPSECNEYIGGKNNHYEVFQSYHKLLDRYKATLTRFRKDIMNGAGYCSPQEFDLWNEYLQKYDPELYKEIKPIKSE